MAINLLLDQLRKSRIEIKYAMITLLLLGGLAALAHYNAFAALNDPMIAFMDSLSKLDFLGMFVIALLGNTILVIQIPYTAPLLAAALNGSNLAHMLFLGIATGLGSGCGVIISYIVADKLVSYSQDIAHSKLFLWVRDQITAHPALIPWIVFIWAWTPVPDMTMLVPLALARYSPRKMAFPLFVGKIFHNLTVAGIFFAFTDWSSRYVNAVIKTDLAVGLLIIFVIVIAYQAEKVKALKQPLVTGI